MMFPENCGAGINCDETASWESSNIAGSKVFGAQPAFLHQFAQMALHDFRHSFCPSGTKWRPKGKVLEEEMQDLRRELEEVRFAPGRADHTETVVDLEERMQGLMRRA